VSARAGCVVATGRAMAETRRASVHRSRLVMTGW
jgi:hypothetical protein